MPKLLRNLLALVLGIVIGSAVNMALIAAGPMLIASPAGVDVKTAEGLRAGLHLFQPQHFVMPFLAHALGTLAGALVAYVIAASAKLPLAYAVGAVFLCGGIAASFMIPAPAWFIAVDLVGAYLPMAWLATRLGRGSTAAEHTH